MNILVFDVGTSGMSGTLFSEDGKQLFREQHSYRVTYLQDGRVEQSPSDWAGALYEIAGKIAGKAAESNRDIEAAALTAQRSSVIPVDASVRPLGKAIMWQDKRTSAVCDALKPENERICALCGSGVNPVYSGSKMAWIRENAPELYSRTAKFLTVADYLNYLMTGGIFTDGTYGSRSNLMNIRTQEWDPELLDLFRVEKEKLPELIRPGSVCGRISASFAAATGIPEGIPVVTAGGDQQCGAIGQGAVRKGALSVTVGTGGYLIAASDEIPASAGRDVICNCSSLPGQYILESSILTCCSAFNWFRREFYPGVALDEINRLIASEPAGSNGCLCIPYFQGRSTPDWNNEAKGVFANVTLATTRQDMLRSLLEAICYEISNGIDTMANYVEVQDIYVNGGLTNSEPFNEMQCNIYNAKITRLGGSDATSRGALAVAAAALGVYSSAEEASAVIGADEEKKVYTPQPELAAQYGSYKEQMNRLYQKIWKTGEADS